MTPRTAVAALAGIAGLALTAGALMTGPANATKSAPNGNPVTVT
jgi:hypothetical protein